MSDPLRPDQWDIYLGDGTTTLRRHLADSDTDGEIRAVLDYLIRVLQRETPSRIVEASITFRIENDDSTPGLPEGRPVVAERCATSVERT